MKITPKICLTKQQEVIAVSCSKTGINSALVMPNIPGMVFEYIHPLAYWANVQGVLKQGRKYLEKLEPQIQAGLVISAYQHFNLLDLYTLTAQEANAVLCTASQDTLVDALVLASHFTAQKAVGTPILSMEWKDIKNWQTIDQTLSAYIKRIKPDFIRPELSPEEARQQRIQVLNIEARDRKLPHGVIELRKPTLSDCEREWEAQFKLNKKAIKALLPKLAGIISESFYEFLNKIVKDRNLVAMSQDLRAKVCTKLNTTASPVAEEIARLIEACLNPYDIFAHVSEDLERASDSFNRPARKRSIAEILADKKRKSQIVATSVEQTEELFDAMQAEGHSAVSHARQQLLDETLDNDDLEEDDSDLLEPVDEQMARTRNGLYNNKDF